MKRGVATLLILTGLLAFSAGALAIAAENPYQSIVDRNVFSLKPPPPPPTGDELAAKQPPPNIFLTGIMTIFNDKRALLKTTPTAGPAKPGAEKPTEQTYMLAEGQRDGDVEVIQIDEKAGSVKIRLTGKDMTVDFENNGIKGPSTGPPGPGGIPGMPPIGLPRPIMPSAMPTPVATSLSANPTASGMPSSTMPSRTLRLPGSPSGSPATPGYAYNSSVGSGVGVRLGGYNTTPGNNPGTQQAQPQITPEEQAIMIEVERERNRARYQNSGVNPLPITPLTPREHLQPPQPNQVLPQ